MDSQSSAGFGAVVVRSTLLIKPKFSLVLCLLFLFIYCLSFVMFALARMSVWMHFLFSTFLIIHFLYVMRRYVFYRHPLSVKRLWCDDRAHWRMQCRDEHVRSARLFQSVMISRYLIFMTFRVPGRFFPVALPLALDSENSEQLRHLRRTLLQTD